MASEPACRILLTGVTGFLGKVVLEELFRRHEEFRLDKVLVLLRPSKGRNAQERFFNEVVPSECFSELPPKWFHLVEAVQGDLAEPDCGIDREQYSRICDETTHIINCAACVTFDLPLADAADANVSTALNLLSLAKSFTRVRAMVTTSTAYAAPHRNGAIKPDIAPLPVPADALYRRIQAGQVDEKWLLRETGYPNTYTLTKCMAVHMYLQYKDELPLTIVRPSIISCSLRYPFPGWIDSKTAVAGFIALMGGGYLRVVDGRRDAILDVVPVDVVAGDLIDHAQLSPSPPPAYTCAEAAAGICLGSGLPIVHSVAGVENGLPIGLIASRTVSYYQKAWLERKTTNPNLRGTPNLTYLGPRNLRYHFHDFCNHRLPLAVACAWFKLLGRGKMARRTRSLARVLKKVNRVFPYYTHHTFDFEAGRSWETSLGLETGGSNSTAEEYLDVICEGVRRHLLSR